MVAKKAVETLACGLVGGDTILSYLPESVVLVISQLLNNADCYQALRFLERMLGGNPIIHIGDVCEAHIFCMEEPSVAGRFLCASAFLTTKDIADFFQQHYPELHIEKEFLGCPEIGVEWGSKKLNEIGFEYKYDVKMILEDSLECARKVGVL